MQALRLIKETGLSGEVLLKLPKRFGHKVEIIVLPLTQEAESTDEVQPSVSEEYDDETLFLAAAYDAVIDDDVEEDAVWRKYLQ